jgi:hypothetical protein
VRVLAWIGRQRARGVAVLVVIGVALPPLGALLKPFVTAAVVGVLCIAFTRIDVAGFRSILRSPSLVIAASVWTMLGVPALTALGCLVAKVDATSPGLFVALMLQSVTSPMMAAPAFAALLGLDATLVLATLLVSSAITPLSAPAIAAAVGLEIPLSPLLLGQRLFAILLGSAAIGLTLRRVLGAAAIARRRDEIDGLNIIILFVFVSAVMGDVGVQILKSPVRIATLTALAFLVFLLLLGVTSAVFAGAGRKRALALGAMTAQKNMGLMLAGTGGLVPDLTWLYIALGQIPIYLSPLLLQPLARRIEARTGAYEGEDSAGPR